MNIFNSKAIYTKVLFIILLITQVLEADSQVDEFNTSYTQNEKEILKKFKSEVKDLISHDWQNEDAYLIWWLRAKDLDIFQAKTMFAKSQKFRRDNKVDGILNEKDLIDLEKKFPIAFGEALDKQGCPAYQLAYGAWDLRKAMVAGKFDLMNRYTVFSLEKICAKMREVKRSQFVFLIDMSMYNLRQHACLPCVLYYANFQKTYENYYPRLGKEGVLINTPRIFEAILQVIRPFMSPVSRKNIRVFGVDKSEWQPYILSRFDANQLTSQYGGTKNS